MKAVGCKKSEARLVLGFLQHELYKFREQNGI